MALCVRADPWGELQKYNFWGVGNGTSAPLSFGDYECLCFETCFANVYDSIDGVLDLRNTQSMSGGHQKKKLLGGEPVVSFDAASEM